MDPFVKGARFLGTFSKKGSKPPKTFPNKGFMYPHQEAQTKHSLVLCREGKVFASTGVRYNLHFAGALGTLFLSGSR